jgi:hypothetical protein
MQAELAALRESRGKQKTSNLADYDRVLHEQGWEVDSDGHFYATNNSEIGEGRPYYVSKKDMNRMNLTQKRNRVTTWDEDEALSESNNLHIKPGYSEEMLGGRRRSSRRNRRGSRRNRRGSRRHRS